MRGISAIALPIRAYWVSAKSADWSVSMLGGAVSNSLADGTAQGSDYVGGLVGLNRGRISASHGKGKVVSDGSYSGGLVGANDFGGRIANSRADSSVSGNLYAGGLVGWNNTGDIRNSYALSRVNASSDVGGLVGWNEDGQMSNTYSSGLVGGVDRVGGLVGSNKGIISDSFAYGQVVASGEHTGGLIGWNYAHQTRHTTAVRVIHSYWDSEASAISLSAGGSLRTATQLNHRLLPVYWARPLKDGTPTIGSSAPVSNIRYSDMARVLIKDSYCRVSKACCRVCSC